MTVYARDDKSGTYDTFRHLVSRDTPLLPEAKRYESSEELSDAVAGDAGGVGFIGLPYVRSAKSVMVQEAGSVPLLPSPLTVSTEDYPLARRLYLYSPPSATLTAREFIDFALSEEGQRVVQASGFVDLRPQCNANAGRCTACTPQYRDASTTRVASRWISASTGAARSSTPAPCETCSASSPSWAGRRTRARRSSSSASPTPRGPRRSGGAGAAARVPRRRPAAGEGPVRGTTVGFGAEMPVADDSTEDGRQRNRRVEVWLH